MSEKKPLPKKKLSADWLMRGVLTKLGDTVDRFTGRRWVPSSSLAGSELIERIKKLLDSEAKEIPGKGTVVPHNIKLKMQWNKFSTDEEKSLIKLRNELLIAVADYINDSLYYTYAPLSLEVKPDYFTEGVKLFAGFDKFDDEDREVEMNVTVPAINVSDVISNLPSNKATVRYTYIATFEIKGVPTEKRLEFPENGRLSVGRTAENALVLEDASVSKIHASLVVDAEGHLSVADTGSTNGTLVNDQRISYGKATPLESSDRVKFGLIAVGFEYVPRPLVPETEETQDERPHEETVEIEGFEFRRRVSPESPDETSPAIPIPSQMLRIDPITVEKDNHGHKALNAAADEMTEETSAAIPVPDETLRIDPIPIEKDAGVSSAPKAGVDRPDDEFKTEV